MIKKILVIFIIGLFLSTSLTTLSALEVTTSSKSYKDGTLTGTVYECRKCYKDDIPNGTFFPLPDANVIAERVSGEKYYTTTDSNGQYTFNNLPKGNYKLYAEKEGFFWGFSKESVYVGEEISVVDLRWVIQKFGEVYGHVYALFDDSLEGAAVTIVILQHQGAEFKEIFEEETFTDSSGYYEINKIPLWYSSVSYLYLIFCSKKGYKKYNPPPIHVGAYYIPFEGRFVEISKQINITLRKNKGILSPIDIIKTTSLFRLLKIINEYYLFNF